MVSVALTARDLSQVYQRSGLDKATPWTKQNPSRWIHLNPQAPRPCRSGLTLPVNWAHSVDFITFLFNSPLILLNSCNVNYIFYLMSFGYLIMD